MNTTERIIMAGVVLMLALFLVIAVQQGQANKQCRKGGGIPVKVEFGYQCITAKTYKP